MKSELVDISSLSHDPANVRKHGKRNLDTIKASLKRFGQQKPIVVDADGVVIAGNGTLEAAKSLGWAQVAVVRSNLLGPDRTAYAIADNRTAELAEWDDEALAKTLDSLDEELREAAGFSDDEFAKVLDQNNPDFAPVGMDDQSRLDEKAPIECPKCGHKFSNG